MVFPVTRMRRLRATERIREMLTETRLHPSRLIYPLFVDARIAEEKKLDLMPGQSVYPLKQISDAAVELEEAGIRSILLFGIPATKDQHGTDAYSGKGVVQQAIRKIKENTQIVVAADLCLCEYTSDGQCGYLAGGGVDNDSTLRAYEKIALSQAEAGADMVAPSGMMDGQVAAIRRALDEGGFGSRMIMAYSSKSASSFYGPFREAAQSAPVGGDRKGHQLNYANERESMREIQLDVDEGADIIMVKPALLNLDIIAKARARTDLPIAAFSVSGEYAMARAAANAGMIEYRPAVIEIITSIFRSGADLVATYHARELVEWLKQ